MEKCPWEDGRTDFGVVRVSREQMYKKRFAKWGFQKNSRRSAAAVQTLTTKDECRRVVSRKPSPPGELSSVPHFPGLGHHDGLMLVFLTSVRVCSVAFFESVQSRDGFLASLQQRPPTDQPWPEKTKDVSFTFKLAVDLLDRGHGNLAGRTTRKAFLLVEDMLTLEAPALVWNLLEMMHHMVTLHHAQLFQMLLAHLIAMIDGRIPKTHPLPAMLHALRGLLASLASVVSTSGGSSLTSSSASSSSSSSPPTSGDRTTTTAGRCPLSRALSSLLERAWILNAEILFDHFDPRLFQLYFRINCDLCSISPPAGIFGGADQWFGHIEAQQTSGAAAEAHRAESLFEITPVEEDRMHQRLLAPRMDASPPQDYEMLRASSVAALREHGNAILSKGVDFTGNTTTTLRILAGMVKAKVLEEWPAVVERSGVASSVTTRVTRVHAGSVACAIRTLMDLNPEHGSDGLGVPLDAVERIRSVVALREYADGETNPQVVREMWLLEDALVAAGEYGEAQEVGQNAFRRLEKYIQDIPADPA
jgi:hypothetical protein